MRRDKEHLELSEAADPKERDRLMQRYCRGWFIGSKDGKKALSEDLVEQHPDVDWEGIDLQELNQTQWETLVVRLLKKHKKNKAALATETKGASWKIEIARALRKQTTANNRWIADRLNMGHPSRVSNWISNKYLF